MEDSDFVYDAFISYRHVDRDRKCAKWLFEKLETYRTPKSLQRLGVPKRLKKIFRDEDELPTSSDLNKDIYDALIKSRFLIVICSTETPKSLWVDKEIQIFRELGRDNRIIALLIESEPARSFPYSLFHIKKHLIRSDGSLIDVDEEKEPLAADIRPRSGEKIKYLKRMTYRSN